jgi:hypothetical protein
MFYRRLLIVLFAAVALVGVGASAQALTWNSKSSPLTVTGYGSTGWGYGTWKASTSTDGTRSRLAATLKYSNADNHKVFAKLNTWVNAGVCITAGYLDCTASYYPYWSADTPRHNVAGVWKTMYASTQLDPGADYARGVIQVKLDIPWRGDPGSGYTFTNGMKY